MEDEGELVADAVGYSNVGELFNDFCGGGVHEVEGALVVWLREAMAS